MLSQLSVKNLAVVEQLDLSFVAGMSAVTGETGAGKSILLQALNLTLGGRADSDLVRHTKSRAEISAVFEVARHQKVQNYLKTQSLEDGGECILRRIISSDGRSKAFVNGVNVPLSVLKGVGELLIDMHGQNEHQLLLRTEQQRELLDMYAGVHPQCIELNQTVSAYTDISRQIDEITAQQDLQRQQQDLLQHQLDELTATVLVQDELDNIESDFKTSANAASLIEKAANILNQFESDAGVNTQLLRLSHELSQTAEIDKKLSPIAQMFVSAQVQTQEGIYELTHYLSNLSNFENNTDELEARLSELHNLARKHNCQITDLLNTHAKLEQALNVISRSANTRSELVTQQSELAERYHRQATALSSARAKSGRILSDSVTEVMQVLGMPGSAFKIDLPVKAHGVHYNGAETVDFLVAINIGQDFKPLKKVASGGELSRISLAISVISTGNEYTPTLIFDEVDVGISGAVAQIVGRKLKQLSANYQVICITHLAQVAAFGHQHLRVRKTQNNEGAQTTVVALFTEDRIDEIARILGGEVVTDKTRKAAEEMIMLSV